MRSEWIIEIHCKRFQHLEKQRYIYSNIIIVIIIIKVRLESNPEGNGSFQFGDKFVFGFFKMNFFVILPNIV